MVDPPSHTQRCCPHVPQTRRGALGLEVPPEKLCPLQKALVLAANLVGKPVAINMLVDSSEQGRHAARGQSPPTQAGLQ